MVVHSQQDLEDQKSSIMYILIKYLLNYYKQNH